MNSSIRLDTMSLQFLILHIKGIQVRISKLRCNFDPEKPADLNPHCFRKQDISVFCMVRDTVKPVVSDHSKIDKTKILMTNGSLMKVKSIAECSHWSILQYFGPALSDNHSQKQFLVFVLSGRLRQILLYMLFCFHLLGPNLDAGTQTVFITNFSYKVCDWLNQLEIMVQRALLNFQVCISLHPTQRFVQMTGMAR